MPRHNICCATTICGSDVLVIPDLTEDLRFCDLPYVTEAPHVRFYAGMPLINSDGYALGTLCVLDFQRREFGAKSCAASDASTGVKRCAALLAVVQSGIPLSPSARRSWGDLRTWSCSGMVMPAA